MNMDLPLWHYSSNRPNLQTNEHHCAVFLILTPSAGDYLPFNRDRMGTAYGYSVYVQQKFSEGIEERPS